MKPILDLSYYQKPEAIDYDLIASQIDGVILRAGYGTGAPGKFTGKDPAFERHYAEFHKRNVPIGAYCFITEYQPLAEQAKIFIDAVSGKTLELGYWADVEIENGAEKLTAKTVILWMNLVEAVVGKCGIYTGYFGWRDIMGVEAGRYADRPLWLAAYVDDPTRYIPPAWNGKYHLWQYTSSGRLAGYAGNLDMSKRGSQMADIKLDIAPLSQVDDRWRYEKLGTSNSTIGGYGCLITSVSMMLKYFGFDTDPSRLNKLLIANGGYHEGNLFVWNSLKVFYPPVTFGYRYDYAALDKIDEQLAAGRPAIIQVDFVPSTSAIDEHWVLVVGKQGSDYIINDPRDGKQHKFSEIYGDPKTGVKIVCTYNFAGSVVQPPEPEPSPIEVGQVVKTLVNLNIRKGAGTSYGVWATAPKGTALDVLEIKGDWVRVGWNQWCMSKYNGERYL